MYGSASTWLFNAVQKIMLVAQPGVRTQFVSGKTEFGALDPAVIHIVKSHEIDDEATILDLERRASNIFITIRDPRDAVASMMMYQKAGFERALDYVDASMRLCLRFAPQERAMVLQYESRFFDNKSTLERIAMQLEIDLTDQKRDKIFDSMRRSEVEKLIAALPYQPGILQDRASGDLLDPKTHWHTHHAGRSGEIGRWRQLLTVVQVREVERRLSDCCKFVT